MSTLAPDAAVRNIGPDSRSQAPAGARVDDFAIVIGIDEYPAFHPLHGAVRDATAFRDWLLDPRGGGLAEAHIKLITTPGARRPGEKAPEPGAPEPRPTQRHVDDALEQLLRIVDKHGGGRRLYFYFAGHGARAIDAMANVALLAADWSSARSRFGLSSQGYANDLTGYGLFSEIAVFLDCCRSDSGAIVGLPCSVTLETLTPKATTLNFVAYATEVNGVAFERRDEALWQGVFTRCLLNVLGRTPGITAADLKRDLQRAVCAEPGGQRAEISNGLDHTARFGVAPSLPELSVTFSPERVGPVTLVDGFRTQIAEHDPMTGPWRIQLPAGLYKLCDAAGPSQFVDFPVESHVVF